MTPPVVTTRELSDALDTLLESHLVADYTGAHNGLQVDHAGPVRAVAAAVDASQLAIEEAIAAGANFLLVHHGLFWGGVQPLRGVHHAKLKALLVHDVAVYSTHLPLDRHALLGNNALLARALDLEPSGRWLEYKGTAIGITADCDLATVTLAERATAFAARHGHHAVVTPHDAARRTRRVAICSGGGASSDSLREAVRIGADTIVTGEGPHHTAVEARELGLVVIYAGHYATETLGVQALAEWVTTTFGLPHHFVGAPTGL
jgi:dinuclear metal center YbgI/SA1388 family protein